jgi:hypothetical protein
MGDRAPEGPRLAHSMARTHLSAGHDVVMPQFVGRLEEIQRFADTAAASGARFCEIVLMDTREAAMSRFARRRTTAAQTLDGWSDWHEVVSNIVAESGGTSLLGQMYDDLMAVLARRPQARVIRSAAGDPMGTYEAVKSALARLHD